MPTTEVLDSWSKTRLNGAFGSTRIAPFTSLHYTPDVTILAMADEVHQKCNAMDAKAFWRNSSQMLLPISRISMLLPSGKFWRRHCRLLIDAPSSFCTSLQLLDSHATPDSHSRVFNHDSLKPNISAYKAKDAIYPVNQLFLMETHLNSGSPPPKTRSMMRVSLRVSSAKPRYLRPPRVICQCTDGLSIPNFSGKDLWVYYLMRVWRTGTCSFLLS
ncbi:hypothetical protein IW262DRAFT_922792 [Armillaria fumosa]|nr:hypothetical protein IW262DRAFT_922792 [Armillaria fumosa]